MIPCTVLPTAECLDPSSCTLVKCKRFDEAQKGVRMFLRMPKCEHVYDRWEPLLNEFGHECGGTMVCGKCGTSAIQESMWG